MATRAPTRRAISAVRHSESRRRAPAKHPVPAARVTVPRYRREHAENLPRGQGGLDVSIGRAEEPLPYAPGRMDTAQPHVVSDLILDRATVPGSEMQLVNRGDQVVIRVGKRTLMSSDVHDSEDELGRIIAAAVEHVTKPRILIGGLGLGFTLRAALDGLPPGARVDVAELVPEVVRWNKAQYGNYAGRPLDDRRVRVRVEDVADAIARSRGVYHAISLDVDNGPSALTHPKNEGLYRRAGLARIRQALRPGGVLAVWSSFPSRLFTKSVEIVGAVELVRTKPTFVGGPRYYIWLARRPV